jgi:hypothetical protein
MYINQTIQLRVEAQFGDQQIKDVTNEEDLIFRINHLGVVDLLAGGRIKAQSAGQARIIASYRGREDRTDVTVHSATLTRIDVEPAVVELDSGDSQQLEVIGTLSDNSQVDLTAGSTGTTYSSTNSFVASVTTEGIIFAYSNGQTTIDVQHGNHSAQVAVQVGEEKNLQSITISPSELYIQVGDTANFIVNGYYSDGSDEDLSNHPDTTLVSSDPNIADFDQNGTLRAHKRGNITITAGHQEFEAIANVYVFLESNLTGIRIEPKSADLSLDSTLQFTVWADYSDNSVLDVTDVTSYSSSNPNVVSVDSSGLATALGSGGSVVTAHYLTFEDTATIVVADHKLVDLDITAESVELEVPGTHQLEVIGTFDDNSQEDLTPASTGTVYDTQNPLIAMVSTDGVLIAVSEGETIVTATNAGHSDTVTVIVSGAALESIEVEPSERAIYVGESFDLTVWANYSDGSRIDVTVDASYVSSSFDVARVSPTGTVTGISDGNATITATFGEQSDTCQVTVSVPYVESVEVEPDSVTLQIHSSVQLTVWANYSDGFRQNVTNQASYLSLDPTIAELQGIGEVVALKDGQTTIEASFAGHTGTCQVTVSPAVLESIDVEPNSVTLDAGETQQLIVWANYDDGSRVNVTDLAGYISSDTNVADIQGAGLIVTFTQGQAIITASFGGKADTCSVEVNPPVLTSLEVIPVSLVLGPGESHQLEVRAHYSDGSSVDVTAQANYASSAPSIVEIQGTGLVVALKEGEATIGITYNNQVATCFVTVTPAILESVEVEPTSLNLDPGDSDQLTVWANFSDNTRVDVTDQAGYISSDPTVADIQGAGLVVAKSEGLATIDAIYGGLSDSCYVSVNPAVLVSIEVEPNSVTLDPGDSQQLIVWANYSDNTRPDVTNLAGFSSNNPAIADIQGAGLLIAKLEGIANIDVSFNGQNDNCAVTVNPASIVSIDVEPPSVTLDIHDTRQLTIWANYNDGSRIDVTAQANYTSLDPSVAGLQGSGEIVAIGEGFTTIEVLFNGQSGTCQVTVNPPILESIDVEPAVVTLNINDTQQLTIWANYDDGSRVDVTSQASYTPLDPTVADMQGMGEIVAIGAGFTTIDVSFDGQSGLCQVTVNPPILESIEIKPKTAAILVGATIQFEVIGHYDDGSQEDLTNSPLTTYISSDDLVLGIDASGFAWALDAGTVTVIVTHDVFNDTASISIEHAMPILISIDPTETLVSNQPITVAVYGSGFDASSVVTLDGSDLATTFIDDTELSAEIPNSISRNVGRYEIAVVNPAPGGGTSDSLEILLIDSPSIMSLSPSSGIQGSAVRVIFQGTGLLNCSVTPANPLIAVSDVSFNNDGTQLTATLTIDSAAAIGADLITLTNNAGSDAASFTVLEETTLPDLDIYPTTPINLPVYLTGVHAYNNITIHTGAQVIGYGTEPLQFLATGNITIRGEIHVSGYDGMEGYSVPADGGEAGPGGGGGGAGGDGDDPVPASGGAGAPPGDNAGTAVGIGTPSGDGGGFGAGNGVSGGCGEGGGGGGFGGDGGNGGGDLGDGTGGDGGLANTLGSDFNGGTGGGGGTTCGINSGGGGGGGGGVLVLSAMTGGDIVIYGALYADGGNGGRGYAGTGAGGGGSGGNVIITSSSGNIVVDDSIYVRGGNGGSADSGDGGGGGGGGRILIDAGTGTVDDTMGWYDLAGGTGGTPLGAGYIGLNGQPGVKDVRP